MLQIYEPENIMLSEINQTKKKKKNTKPSMILLLWDA